MTDKIQCDEYVLVYVDLVFEEYNVEEDIESLDLDELRDSLAFQDRQPTYLADRVDIAKDCILAFMEPLLYQYTSGVYAHNQEGEALRRLGARLRWAGLDVNLCNEGHTADGVLVVKFTLRYDHLEKLLDFVTNNDSGGGGDYYAVDVGVRYFAFQAWQLYPRGTAGDSDPVSFEDIISGEVNLTRENI